MYLVLLGAISLFAITFLNDKYKNGRKYFCVATAILLILYASLRSKDIYPDTPHYYSTYLEISEYNWGQALALFELDMKNPSFYFLGWIVSRIFPSGQVWLAFLSILYIVAIMWFIFKESEIPFISVVVFLTLAYFTFSLTGLRQTLAMTLLIPAYFLAKNNKFWKFLLVVLIASLFHITALIFLLIYPLRNAKLGIFHFVFFIFGLIVAFVFQSQFKEFIGELFEDSYLGGYADNERTLSMSGFVIQLAIFIFNIFYYKSVCKNNKNALILYNLVFLGLASQLFSIVIAEMFRISRYFSIFNLILVPLSIMAEPNMKWRNIEMILITIVLFAYIFVGGVPSYSFYW